MKVVNISAAPRARRRRETASKQQPERILKADASSVSPTSEPDQPFEEGAHDSIDPDLRHRLISEAAFDLYTKRGFVDGYDVDDWLVAETEVDHLLLNPQFPERGGRGA
ncbi:hypothetical protein SBBP1_260047 [Burkholderiales bacterium]|nr:hypothetical protein SBBP1_260047 [Burkholderiales bacterium]